MCKLEARLFPNIFSSEGSAASDFTPISCKMLKSSLRLAAEVSTVPTLFGGLRITGNTSKLREVRNWNALLWSVAIVAALLTLKEARALGYFREPQDGFGEGSESSAIEGCKSASIPLLS